MRIRTIHRNKLGDVYNECSAHGFEITTGDGTRITVMVDDDGSIRPARAMSTNIEVLRELDELVEAARLLGATQAKKLFGEHTDEDRRFERVMYESIDRRRAALLDWEAKQPVTVDEAAAQRLADAAKADLGWSHLSPQARVEKARRYLAIAAQQEEAK